MSLEQATLVANPDIISLLVEGYWMLESAKLLTSEWRARIIMRYVYLVCAQLAR
jgi:hypothetical protein